MTILYLHGLIEIEIGVVIGIGIYKPGRMHLPQARPRNDPSIARKRLMDPLDCSLMESQGIRFR